MPTEVPVYVPKSSRRDFDAFLHTPTDQLATLVEFLSSAQPATSIEDLAEQGERTTKIPAKIVESVLTVAININHIVRESHRPAATLLDSMSEALEALQQLGYNAWQAQTSQAWKERQPYLKALVVKNGPIDRMSKAAETNGSEQADPQRNQQSNLAYDLPGELLAAYHTLLDKKFSIGLTAEEEYELQRVDAELDKADMATPLEQSLADEAAKEHKRRIGVLDNIIAQLKSL